MIQPEAERVQKLPFEGKALLFVTVQQIAHHGVPYGFGVHADLVRSARVQLEPHERVVAEAS